MRAELLARKPPATSTDSARREAHRPASAELSLSVVTFAWFGRQAAGRRPAAGGALACSPSRPPPFPGSLVWSTTCRPACCGGPELVRVFAWAAGHAVLDRAGQRADLHRLQPEGKGSGVADRSRTRISPGPAPSLTWAFAWQVLDSNQGRHTSTVLQASPKHALTCGYVPLPPSSPAILRDVRAADTVPARPMRPHRPRPERIPLASQIREISPTTARPNALIPILTDAIRMPSDPAAQTPPAAERHLAPDGSTFCHRRQMAAVRSALSRYRPSLRVHRSRRPARESRPRRPADPGGPSAGARRHARTWLPSVSIRGSREGFRLMAGGSGK
jgi:hypothetical protein